MPTLHIAEYQSFELWDIQRILDSHNIESSHKKAQKIFQELKDFALHEDNHTLLGFQTPSRLKAKNYVGTIQTRSGFCIEILPKTFRSQRLERDSKQCECKIRFEKKMLLESFSDFSKAIVARDSTHSTTQASLIESSSTESNKNCDICQAKGVLLSCLATLKDMPFKQRDFANLHTLRFPLLEIFVRMFLSECERLSKAGLNGDYLCIAQNRAFLKGKLEFKDHITQNLIHKERFFTSSDEYTQDIAPNRLIKSTLLALSHLNLSPSTQTRADSIRFVFADINPSKNIESALTQCSNMSRAKEYEVLLLWCKIFLGRKAFSPYAGRDRVIALLFPMEKLFESYVSFWLKKCANGFSVKTQESQKYFIQDENKKNVFCLKPDIILRGKGEIVIIDTKWKIPDSNANENKYGISQGDLYQMWAYASKYQLECKDSVRVVLIHPQCEQTQELQESWHNKQWTFKASRLDLKSLDSKSNTPSNKISLSLAFAPLYAIR